MFNYQKKIIEASYPRSPGSTLSVDDRLKIAYNKFTSTSVYPEKIRIDMIFCHGTGMNKDIWTYYIEKLFTITNPQWYLGSCIAIDCVNHGDSALLNNGKLGWAYMWMDGSRDILKVIEFEQNNSNEFMNNRLNRTILVGHSLGGHQSLMASFLNPNCFDTIVPIDPIVYTDKQFDESYRKGFFKLGRYIEDEFESLGEFEKYYRERSFLRNMNPEILDNVISNEYYTVTDANGNIKYKSKSSKISQMAVYGLNRMSLKKSTAIFPLLENQVVLVVGGKSPYNIPVAVQYMKDNIKRLISVHSIENGKHILNGENPNEILQILCQVLERSGTDADLNKNGYPEAIFGERSHILKNRSELFMKGNIEESFDFRISRL